MTTEQREAIEYLKESVLIYKNTIPKISQSIDTVLSLIKQLESEKEIHIGLEHQYKKEYLDMSELNQKLKKQIEKLEKEIKHWKNGFERELENNRKNTCELLKQDLVIRKKDKIIYLMSEQLAGLTIWNIEKDEPLILGDKEAVINYFENKVNRKES